MKIRVKADAATEPISLTTAKDFLRIDGTWSDAQITTLIKAGRQAAEDFTNISIPIQTLELAFDEYPPDEIELPKGPLVSLEAITLTEQASGVTSSVLTTSYITDTFGSRIVKKNASHYPSITLQETNGFVVEYKAGYSVIPEPITQAILLYIKGQYECIPPADYMTSFERLLYPYKVVSV